MTTKVPKALFFDGSSAVYVTKVVPMLNCDPGSMEGDTVNDTLPELSVALGFVQFTTAVGFPGSVVTDILLGTPCKTGASLSEDQR